MARGLGHVQGRLAVVTGAASGIGRATARELARRGAELALCDVDAERLERVAHELMARGALVTFRTTDVTRVDEVERFAALTLAERRAPDLLVNAAGVLVLGSFAQTTPDDWDHVIGVNLKGPVHVCRAFLPAMIARGTGGAVVNVASASAFATQSEIAAYGTTKHALFGLTQALADELGRHGISVSAVCPGFVDTPILERARVRGDDPEASRRAAANLLRRRRLSPERVAERIVRAAERGIAVVPVGLEARALWLLSRFAPGRVPLLFGALRRLGSRT
ncbi:MAG TPA: SDR family NAD(P)-dependent oxidoreductase [Polyangiaceae bacterium]|nr:SDR family NAD(P)-dependent oxidoreductase [Polyangiaceae bacterium]